MSVRDVEFGQMNGNLLPYSVVGIFDSQYRRCPCMVSYNGSTSLTLSKHSYILGIFEKKLR